MLSSAAAQAACGIGVAIMAAPLAVAVVLSDRAAAIERRMAVAALDVFGMVGL